MFLRNTKGKVISYSHSRDGLRFGDTHLQVMRYKIVVGRDRKILLKIIQSMHDDELCSIVDIEQSSVANEHILSN